MRVVRDPSVEEFVFTEMRRVLSRPREGVHVSDLLALRKAYWNRVSPKELTEDEILYFTAGRGHEDIVRSLSQVERGQAIVSEAGVHYTPDFYTNFPIELKSRRSGYIPKDEEVRDKFDHYLDQLGFYCSLSNRPAGWLWVLFLSMVSERNPDLGWRCQYCGSASDLHVHHIQPRSRAGGHLERNLITLCANCHQQIHLGRNPHA